MALIKPLLNLCKTRTAATRDGYTAGTFMNLPFYGLWSPTGKILAFPGSSLGQAVGITMNGRSMPNTYHKGQKCG